MKNKHIQTFENYTSIKEDVFVLWADRVTDNLPKAIKKAKYKGKGGKAWDDQYKINAKSGSGSVFFVDATNVADAKQKIQNLTKKKDDNVYIINESADYEMDVYLKGTRFEKDMGYFLDDDYYAKLKAKGGILEPEDIGMADDWMQATRKSSNGWNKYGRVMFSPTIERLRHQTMMEFYGDGIVD